MERLGAEEEGVRKELRHKYAGAVHDLKYIIGEISKGYRFGDDRAGERIAALQRGVKTLIELHGEIPLK
jgi:hypothetical protein